MKLNKIDEGSWFETVRIYFLSEFSVCCDPKILLPWQRDVTTSPLYYGHVFGLGYTLEIKELIEAGVSFSAKSLGHQNIRGSLDTFCKDMKNDVVRLTFSQSKSRLWHRGNGTSMW